MCRARAAYSVGDPSRAGCGTCLPSDSRAGSGRPASIGVSMIPGAIVHTRMSLSARSRAIGSVMPTTPPFDALYAAWPICPSNAATDAVLTMTPRSPSTGSVSTIAAAASRITLKVPIRLIRTTFSNASSGSTPCLPSTRAGVPTPAQLTTIRSGAWPTAVCTACCTPASSVTSRPAKLPPISFARSSPGDVGRSGRTTCAPALASSVAVANPNPLAPPVTIAEQPSIRIRACLFLRYDDEHRARLDLLTGLHPHLGDRARCRRGDGVLHLHRLQHDERLPSGDVRAGLDEHPHDRPGHGRDERARDVAGVRLREPRLQHVRRPTAGRVDVDGVVVDRDVATSPDAVDGEIDDLGRCGVEHHIDVHAVDSDRHRTRPAEEVGDVHGLAADRRPQRDLPPLRRIVSPSARQRAEHSGRSAS